MHTPSSSLRAAAGNAALETIFSAMSSREGVVEYLPNGATLDIEGLLPPRDKR